MVEYTYYEALKPDGTPKEGINRITWEVDTSGNRKEITREYLPEGNKSSFIKVLSSLTEEELVFLRDFLNNISNK